MSGEGFYRRWSNRKAETRQEPKAARAFAALDDPPALDLPPDLPPLPEAEGTPKDIVPTPPDPDAPDQDAPEQDQADPEADLPDVEELDYDSDYRGFLSEGVSDELRNRALRRLWRSNPLLANLDGLNDYDEDFTDAATVITGMKTAFDAVRGYAPPPEEEEAGKEDDRQPSDSDIAAADSAAETEGQDPDASEEEPSRPSGKYEIIEENDQV